MKVSKTAVQNAILKYQNEGVFIKSLANQGFTNSREDRLMYKVVIRSPISTSEKIHAKLMETSTTVRTKTIQRRLSLEFGVKSCKSAQKPHLTQAMKKKRPDFAKRHGGWDIEMQKKVFFRTSLLYNSFLFKDIKFGGLLEQATRKNTLPKYKTHA